MWTVLLEAVLVVGVTSSADAWRRHHGYYGDGERGSARSLDEWRARQAQGQNNEQDQNRDQARGDDRRIVIATGTIAGTRAMTNGAAPARIAAAIATRS